MTGPEIPYGEDPRPATTTAGYDEVEARLRAAEFVAYRKVRVALMPAGVNTTSNPTKVTVKSYLNSRTPARCPSCGRRL